MSDAPGWLNEALRQRHQPPEPVEEPEPGIPDFDGGARTPAPATGLTLGDFIRAHMARR